MQPLESPQDPERQRRFEDRSCLNSKAMAKGIALTSEHIKYLYGDNRVNPNFKTFMTGDIAGLLRNRMSTEDVNALVAKFTPAKLKIFERTISISKKMYTDKLGLIGQRGNGESFWEVADPKVEQHLYPEKIKGPNGQQVEIQHKEYFTFVPLGVEPEELLQEIIRFYDALLRAFERIKGIGKRRNTRFIMKFKDDLAELLMDLDTVVLYVPDSETGQLARKIIDQ